MKDRIPVNPGRVKVEPENGSDSFFATITTADNATEQGTPLNKYTLLRDETAEKMELSDALPDRAHLASWDAAMRADGIARAGLLDGNVNDTMNRSALGEFISYRDTYGLGYAIAFHCGITNENDVKTLGKYRHRKAIANSSEAMEVIKRYPAAVTLWRRYIFGVVGKYSYTKTLLGTIPVTGGFKIIRNPLNGYLYACTATKGNGTTYYSTDNGRTWASLFPGHIEFSSDYIYTYGLTNGSSNSGDYVYPSTNGIPNGSTYFNIPSNYGLAGGSRTFMFKCGSYYYYMYEYVSNTVYASVYLMKSDGKTLGTQVAVSSTGYASYINCYKVGNGAIFTFMGAPTSNQSSGAAKAAFWTVFNDVVTEYGVGYTETGTPDRNADVHTQFDTSGNAYLYCYGKDPSTGTEYKAYYKVSTGGTVTQLSNSNSFPCTPDKEHGYTYNAPLGEVYQPIVDTLEGKLVHDNFGVASGVTVTASTPNTPASELVNNKTVTWYSTESATNSSNVYKHEMTFNDGEAI